MRKAIDWGKEARLGKISDSDMAEALGVTRQAVAQARMRRGIPVYTPEPESGLFGEGAEAVEAPHPVTGFSGGPSGGADGADGEAGKEEKRKEARREAQKVAATLEGTARAADPAEVEVARGIVADMLSDAAVAVALGTTKFTVQRYIREKKLHAVKIGGAWKIPAEALKRFLSGE